MSHFGAKKYDRCKKILWETVIFSAICMIIGTLVFELFPKQLLSIFAKGNEQVIKIGINAPKDVPIYRKEVYLQIQEENKAAISTIGPDALKNLLG